MDDRDAVARIKQGDIGGLEVLVHRYQRQALRTAYLVCLDRELAQDIAQDAFVCAYECIQQFDSQREFAPWFLRIVANQALMAVRRQQHVPLDEEVAEATWPDESPSPEQLLVAAETSEAVWATLSRLAPQQRSAIVLRYYVGLNQAEMCHVLRAPPGTIKRRLHDARRRLHNLLPASLVRTQP
jgi:RNA polymerase sigma-70 factor (ECF subfamily)